MCHQAQNGFHGIFLGIPQHPKVYLVYVMSTRKIIYSYDDVFDEHFSSTLAYTSQPYSDAMAMRPSVSYISFVTYPKEKTGDIINFALFDEGNLLSETCQDSKSDDESGDESDYGSIIPRLLSLEETDTLDSGNESDNIPMSTEIL